MKVLGVIDHFGSGGAQRQMVELACGLKGRGHDMELFVYHPQFTFFRPEVSSRGIRVHEYDKGAGFSVRVITTLASVFNANRYDIVVSFLRSPGVYAELSRFAAPSMNLVVAERSSHLGDRGRVATFVRRHLHRWARHVVANSHAHAAWLEREHRWLRGKVTTIYNGLDVGAVQAEPRVLTSGRDVRLIAIGRVGPEKNLLRLLMALEVFHSWHGWVPQVSWVGRRDTSPRAVRYGRTVDAWLTGRPEIRKHWHWLGERADIQDLVAEHHALIHPSLYEGLPNVVCEALAGGRPVLASNVCDHGRLVAEGERGFLFDPHDAVSIAEAIRKLTGLEERDWIMFSRNARRYAESALTTERMVGEYEALFSRLTGRPSPLVGASANGVSAAS